MNKLTFTSVYGDETRTVEISSASGGGGSFHIMQTLSGYDGTFLIGQVSLTLNGWAVYSTAFYAFNKSPREIELDEKYDRIPFTQDDKDAILERMEQAGMI